MENINSAVATLIHGSNTLFILLGAIMVLAMHAGYAFLEVGTVRQKNQVNALSKILSDFAISALAYFFIGYWIAYGINFLEPAAVLTENHGYGLVKFFFLLTFAAAIPAIISGGIAERAKFGPQLCATAWTRKLRPGAGLLRKDAQPQIVGAAPRREPGGVGFESFAPRRGSYAKMPSRKL